MIWKQAGGTEKSDYTPNSSVKELWTPAILNLPKKDLLQIQININQRWQRNKPIFWCSNYQKTWFLSFPIRRFLPNVPNPKEEI